MGKNGARIGTVIGGFGKVGRRSQIQCLVIMGTCNGEDRRRWRRLVKVGHLFPVHIHGGQRSSSHEMAVGLTERSVQSLCKSASLEWRFCECTDDGKYK